MASKSQLCGLFGFSRQAWYDIKKRRSSSQMEAVFILGLVKELRKEHKRMGVQKLHLLLHPTFQEHHIKCGRDKLYSLLQAHGLLVKRHRSGSRTTDSNHHYRRYANLIRDLSPTRAGQLWVSDITYLRTRHGFVYLSLVTDAYSKKIVGWSLWPNLTSAGPLNALQMAVELERGRSGLIHHSDRGIQYCCHDYVAYLQGADIAISMTENGDPYENAIAERVNGILKDEYELNGVFEDYNHAMEMTKRAVYKYNTLRPHRSVDLMVPIEAHNHSGSLKKHWKKRDYPAQKKSVNSARDVPEKSTSGADDRKI